VYHRWYPIFPVRVGHAATSILRDGLLDSGSDDTVCPEDVAQALGIDLTNAPEGDAGGVGGAIVRVRYATVTLRITDGNEDCEWQAMVGFAPTGRRRLLLGETGFLQYFDASLLNPFREIVLTPNSTFPEQRTTH